MHPTDTTEKGLEALIVRSLIDEAGYLPGDPGDYDREHGVDLAHLVAFLRATQPQTLGKLGIKAPGPRRTQFLHRLQGEVARRGVIDVLRRASSMVRTISTCFTVHRLQAISRRWSVSRPTASASPASCATHATRPGCRWTWRSSSMVCRSRPSNSRTA